MIKAVFFDLDGTLLSSDGKLSSSTKHAVKMLQENKIPVSLATGRSLFGAQFVIDELEIIHPSMFFSGALIFDTLNSKAILAHNLNSNEITDVYTKCSEMDLYLELYTEANYFIEKEGPLTELHADYLGKMPEVIPFDDLIKSHTIIKAVAVASNDKELLKLKELQAALPTLTYGIASGAKHPDILFANITNPEATRQSAFGNLIELLGVRPEETAALGDADSDIPFLQLAGYGIAMGNSSFEVKEKANFVTHSVDDDGILYAIEKFILSERENDAFAKS